MKGKDYLDSEELLLEELAGKLEEDTAIYVKEDGTLIITDPREVIEEFPLTLSKPRQIWY